MKFREAVCVGLAVLGGVSLLHGGHAWSQDPGAGGAPPAGDGAKTPNSADPRDNDMAAGMKRWMDTMKAGPQHERLAKRIGSWDLEFHTIMGPGLPPVVTKGTAEISWLHPGKWIQQHAEWEFNMGAGPVKMKGFGITGYDNYKRKYVGTWCDSKSTTLHVMQGNYDGSRKNLLMFGLMDEPMTGEHDKTVRYVTRDVSDDEFTYEVHDLVIGEGDCKVIEIRYRRRK